VRTGGPPSGAGAARLPATSRPNQDIAFQIPVARDGKAMARQCVPWLLSLGALREHCRAHVLADLTPEPGSPPRFSASSRVHCQLSWKPPALQRKPTGPLSSQHPCRFAKSFPAPAGRAKSFPVTGQPAQPRKRNHARLMGPQAQRKRNHARARPSSCREKKSCTAPRRAGWASSNPCMIFIPRRPCMYDSSWRARSPGWHQDWAKGEGK
jgi:hypothetical protein